MTISNTNWLKSNSEITWICYNEMFARYWSFWSSATTKCTSMGLGNQKGFNTDQSNAPNQFS